MGFIKALFAPANPPNTVTTLEVDGLTVVGLVAIVATIVTVFVSAVGNVASIWGLSQGDIVYIGAVAGGLLIICRMAIAAFANKGISAHLGFLTKVENGISSYVGYGLTAITWLTAAIASGAGYNLPGVTNAELAKVGAGLAIATGIGKAIQLALQNLNFSVASSAAEKVKAALHTRTATHKEA